jgi:glycerol-3-phosphate dehydrogenase
MIDRAAMRRSLETPSFDLVVVGGGITGAGVARDAALRGLRVALVEKGDLARGTSSASSKLIHGGLRYLEQLELGLVREGVRERSVLMKLAPHLARPLPFIFPIYKTSRAGPLKVAAGMWLYDALALFQNYRTHRMLRRRQVERLERELRSDGLQAGTLYYDCMTDDGRLTVETAVDAAARGATIATYHEVTGFRRDPGGQVSGVLVRDVLGGGEPFPIKAKVTLSATGPWTDELLKAATPTPRTYLRPTKGVHIVVSHERLPISHALVLTAVRDERVLFAIPWGERSYIGTTDTDDASSPEHCQANAWDVEYLLETANHYFPRMRATPDDVIATWAGLRPLIASDPAHPSDVSREHEVLDVAPGLLAIAGGKLTTYRLMAEQTVDRVLVKLGVRSGPIDQRSSTETTPLPGAADPEALADLPRCEEELARAYRLPADVARQLLHSYGLRAPAVIQAGRDAGLSPDERIVPDLPYTWSEVPFAATHDFAARVEDVLRRRTLVFLKDRDQGLGVAARTAEILGRILGWDEERRAAEVESYRAAVAASRSFKRAGTPGAAPTGVPEELRK